MTELLGRVSPERKDLILKRAEELVREERGRSGRSAPDQNQSSAADWAPLYRYLRGVVLGAVAGLILGYGIGAAFPQHDSCQVRASSAHVSLCLDSQLAKAKGLLR